MPHPYTLADAAEIFTPNLVFYPDLIRKNITRTVEMAGSPDRLRPHVKTHKTREITRMQARSWSNETQGRATIAEVEMLASAGAPDVMLAYPLVGPNGKRMAALAKKYPETKFSALFDTPQTLAVLAEAAKEAGRPLGAFIDLNVGMDRSGIVISDTAVSLYEQASKTHDLRMEGLHAYDGQTRHPDPTERLAAVKAILSTILELRSELEKRGLPVPRVVVGGTPSFPSYASIRGVPGLECSPGTYVLHDHGYGSGFPDYPMTPAAALLTRVVSRPTPTRVTFDLGNKSVAADPAMVKRVHLLDAPEYTIVTHSEEHLVIETPHADQYQPGDLAYALPGHICPSVALYKEVLVAEGGRIVDRWEVAARNRVISV